MNNFINDYFKKQQEKVDKLYLVDNDNLDINSRLNKIIDECIGDEYNIEKAFNTKYLEWNDMTEGVFDSMFDWLEDFFCRRRTWL